MGWQECTVLRGCVREREGKNTINQNTSGGGACGICMVYGMSGKGATLTSSMTLRKEDVLRQICGHGLACLARGASSNSDATFASFYFRPLTTPTLEHGFKIIQHAHKESHPQGHRH